MQPRGRLDISLPQLLRAALPAGRSDRALWERDIAACWGDVDRTVVALSVRSAFEAALATLDWPPGSIVLMSAINIADMGRIVTERGFRLVPLAVDADTLAPDPQTVIDTIARLRADPANPPIRALCLTHLFGSRIDLTPFVEIARRYEVQLWEDAAQAFAPGLPATAGQPGGASVLPVNARPAGVDLSLTSFGLIKTQTALGGGLASFRDVDWCERTRRLMDAWPRQSEREFLVRGVLRGIAFSLLTRPITFTLFANAARGLGFDLDDLLARTTRGFSSGRLLEQIRRQPSVALLDLLARRLTHPAPASSIARTRIAAEYRRRLPAEVLVGMKAVFPTVWVFPILVPNPETLRHALAAGGYDATCRASRLVALSASSGSPLDTHQWLNQLLYLPLQPQLKSRHLDHIAQLVRAHLDEAKLPPAPSTPT
jgi:perosamine synthetase